MMLSYLILSLAVGVLCQNSAGPIVDTPLGKVLGWERKSRDGRLYQAWTGIPYAQPPVGKLRFQAPKPCEKWSSILNATSDQSLCLQKNRGVIEGSEDCLYLSVYRPKSNQQNLPVLVRVHGGAFQVGSLGTRENADYLMDEDVVLVQIHYRLNGFGFASLGDKLMPGNFGIKDQVMALKWIHQNIASFGGNPNSVTALGESAGGASVHILLKTPAAEGLIHRALSDSGTSNRFWSGVKSDVIRNGTLQLASKVGCRTTGDNMEIFRCLQKTSSTKLIGAMADSMAGISSFAPCIEPKDSEDAVITEDLSMVPSNKPWITSNCNGEYLLSYSSLKPQVIADAQKNLNGYLETFIAKLLAVEDPARTKVGAEILKKSFFPIMEPLQNFSLELAQIQAYSTFFYPALYNLMYHRGPKWYYHFEYIGEITKNQYAQWFPKGAAPNVAPHADQRLYYFNERSKYNVGPTDSAEDYRLSKRMIKYLVNFAYYDDPTPEGVPSKWNQFSENQILRITNSQSDFMGDHSFYQPFINILNTFSYVIGW